ncbi:hypothetical protein SAMN02910357_02606, partial [Succinivibrio dextrinosolvens]|uniref:hypothetical protein n=1 Tax=Succinivibrio dextrinosolvens TaxID=83771 RepID=UPI0008EFD588
ISNPGLYTHIYSSKSDGTEFYFVKNNEVSDSVPHYVKVTDPTVVIPTPADEIAYNGDNLKLSDKSSLPKMPEGDSGYKREKYDRKHYKATMSFLNRVKPHREKISRRLIASLNLENSPSGKEKTYAYKRSEKENAS